MPDIVTERFVDAAVGLPAPALHSAFERMLDLADEGGREASDAAVPSAARNSALDRRIRAGLLPRAEELDAHRAGLHSDARVAISVAARAVLTRHRLTAEQFGLLVAPFAAYGLVPRRHAP
ncbi:hypothetical protein [Streptomyces genisteinicus]|uniref:Uncharacterized protein n=1 Tax=Streptomyces genisteinicus TaxID=2768068 RepID=A0A7H0HZE6_9ACTN|nr:hypothetical protein [Streptomyces genisteinicus]QNP65912.1 hypothetical protein IAG43_25275 [Streptomyces genisteinicus]